MTYTQLVTKSIIPALLIIAGLGLGEVFYVLAIGGGIWEALVIARFLDRRKNPPGGPPLPPNVFKKG